jgi:hypothetical protein
MTTSGLAAAAAATLGLGLAAACDQAMPTAASADAKAIAALGEPAPKKLDIARCAPGAGVFTLVSTNPYFPLDVGRQLILTGEEGGDQITLHVTVLDRTRVIDGVTTRVVEEREFVNGELSEVSWNYHVQAPDGSICYYGEDEDAYEEGSINHVGAWCAGGNNEAGIFMPADPQPGMKYQNEVAPGIALDEATIVGVGPWTVPFDRFTETIRIREFDPLDGSKDHKVHAAGVGIIMDGTLQLVDIRTVSGVPDSPSITVQNCGS